MCQNKMKQLENKFTINVLLNQYLVLAPAVRFING